MKYKIDTEILSDGRILSEVKCEFDGVMQTLYRQVLCTQEESVKAALIELGWTPPATYDQNTTPQELDALCKRGFKEGFVPQYEPVRER